MTEEFVWKEDVEKEVEYLGEGARNISTFFYTAMQQGASQELLAELNLVYQDLDNAKKRLKRIAVCFPEEPI